MSVHFPKVPRCKECGKPRYDAKTYRREVYCLSCVIRRRAEWQKKRRKVLDG
jgi:hypothetical protein